MFSGCLRLDLPSLTPCSEMKTSEDEPKFLGTESISRLLCRCTKESTNAKLKTRALKNVKKMNSISKSMYEESKPKDTPAMKGILTLFFCILYAAVLFVTAGVLSKAVSTFGKSASSTPRVKVHMWEADTRSHIEVRQNRLAHSRWGQ